MFPLLKFMFEKCEQITHNNNNNSDYSIQNKPFNESITDQRFYNRNHGFNINDSQLNESKTFEHELRNFLNENQHVIMNSSSSDDKNLDDMVI